MRVEEADHLQAQVARHLEAFEERGYFPGMEQYKPFLGKLATLFDYLPEDLLLILDEPLRLKEAVDHAYLEISETIAQLVERGKVLPALTGLYRDWTELWQIFQRYNPFTFPCWVNG